jgi:deoxyadenosine/deoxycytidine kinase
LARHFGWEVHYEDTTNNPYLSDFYDDMHRWSFNLQIYFLNSRYQQIIQIRNGDKTVIQDRTIFEDAYIFAPNLHEMGLMSRRDFENYFTLFKNMNSQVSPPDLLIYIQASIPTLVKHILPLPMPNVPISVIPLRNMQKHFSKRCNLMP